MKKINLLGDRDLAASLASVLLGAPTSLVLGAGALSLADGASLARPELGVASLLSLVVATALAWNAICSLAALLSLLPAMPRDARLFLSRALLAGGTGAARRLALRTGASATIGFAVVGVGACGAIAAPAAGSEGTSCASDSWIWRPTVESPDSRESGAPRATGGEEGPRPHPCGGDAECLEASRPDPSSESPSHSGDARSASDALDAPARTPRRSGAPPSSSSPSARVRAAGALGSTTPASSIASEAPEGEGESSSSPRPSEGAPTRVVLPGDSLWSIAEELLPAESDEPAVASAWRSVYDLNRERIGADPDLIRPGEILALPQELS